MTSETAALLARIATAQRAGRWLDLDGLLIELAPLFEPDLVGPLLSTIADDFLGEEVVFGLVHLAESVESSSYIAGLLDALPTLRQNAPRWARTLLARVFNAPGDFAVLLETAPNASSEQRAALADTGARVEAWEPVRFGGQYQQLLTSLARSGARDAQ